MKVCSLFAGIGGFDLALIRQGHEIIYANEWDKYAAQIYEKNIGQLDTRDIREVKDIPDHDLLTAGFPCQSFSIAGKRGGFDDTRGTLFFEIARIAKQKQPRLLLLENVKGLLSHDKGATFGTILNTLDELGYDLQWQVLNSKNFGVPQNRERVFIVGHLRGTPRPEVFPLGSDSKETYSENAHTISAVTGLKKVDRFPTLDTMYKKGLGSKQARGCIVQLNNPTHSNNRLYSDKGISPALNTAQGGNRQPKIVRPVLTPDRAKKRQNGRRIKEDGEPSFTLTGQDKHGVMVDSSIRRLTPLECERLQGFPDGWTEGISDTQRYKCLGNAVTVNVIEAIINKLKKK